MYVPDQPQPEPRFRDSNLLEPCSEELAAWFKQTEILSQKFLQDLKTAPAYQVNLFEGDVKRKFREDLKEEFNPIPEVKTSPQLANSLLTGSPLGFQAALTEALDRLTQCGIDSAGGRYFGYIPGGGVPVAAFGDFVSALTNRYAGMYQAAPGAVEIENEVLKAFLDLFEFPSTAWGTLTSGGSIANLTAILAARQTRPRREWDRSTIYLTEQSHNSVQRALKIAGLDPELSRLVPVDSNFRMDSDQLRVLIQKDIAQGLKPWIIISALGTTNTGSVDPIQALVKIKKEFELWLHIDAAYGGFFCLSEAKRAMFQGVSEADSIILDPHKSLFMPYGCGAVLVRKGELLKEAFAGEAVYMSDLTDAPGKSPADYSPELTRPFRGLRIYLSLKTYGIEPFRAALNEKLQLTEWAYKKLKEVESLEFACSPDLSLIVFRIRGADSQTQELLKKILARGRVHLSSTRLGLEGRVYLRMCILSFRSHLAEVEECISEIQQCAFEIQR